ncbi:hypothetical protein GCM10011492_39460 [Flexivirga endophytica]|uniref:DUF779 domain-containing protein n=1 Tax=Flexivirga endophytica TaxID=1849103 RepID=A0A916X0L3_9MICO|nr:DUF779 domain-containing protein [Flexivirga endophytica]GGB44486.1 hypothetical protein GCM10011492_39460 [Flexivirga endophytica]GHB60373.1 hypothetical protein GCM10008112_31660 [Flexivirga endophytica]
MADSHVAVTDEAAQMLRRLVGEHGPLMFHQSGGCCDGSSPMCYPQGEYRLGQRDVRLGELPIGDGYEPVPVYISGEQYEVWRHTDLTIDLVPGRGAGFSLEGPTGYRFLTRSDVCRTP